jgi:FkbM family methyltransferase
MLTIFRKSAVWLLRKLNPGDIHIRHHYTGDRFSLNAYKHKNYWFHGKRREAGSMQFFRDLISPGDIVLEAGGHIGYLSMYFAQLCGQTGRVIVFEPSPENLSYLRRNTAHLPQVAAVDLAVGSSNGPRDLFIEDITGQNNSFYSDYDIFKKNSIAAGYKGEGYHAIRVQVITIDDYCRENNMHVDFVKIDIEGAELEALEGMEHTTEQQKPRFMVEVSRKSPEAFEWFQARDYLLFDDQQQPLPEPPKFLSNMFCLHREAHADLIARVGHGAKSKSVFAGRARPSRKIGQMSGDFGHLPPS